ncbi:MAG: hypothetical protein RLZZ214_2139 [Verrucomicrobiota bacterium]
MMHLSRYDILPPCQADEGIGTTLGMRRMEAMCTMAAPSSAGAGSQGLRSRKRQISAIVNKTQLSPTEVVITSGMPWPVTFSSIEE